MSPPRSSKFGETRIAHRKCDLHHVTTKYLRHERAIVRNGRHAEVDAVAGEAGRISVADLPRLALTARAFAEALWLYPPVSAFGRRALESCELGGYAIARGDGIVLSPYVSHRNPAVFAAPAAFAPDRWLNAVLPPFAYFPFGGGSRLSIGEAFARMEGTLVLASIAQRFALRAIDSTPIDIAATATLWPARPIVLRAHRRPA